MPELLDPAAASLALALLRAQGDDHAAAELLHQIGESDVDDGEGETTESILREHGFTGVDKRGVHWVDGVPQKKADSVAPAEPVTLEPAHDEHALRFADEVVTEVANAFPDHAKDSGLWGKVTSLAKRATDRLNKFVLEHAGVFGRLGQAANIIDAVLTSPPDIAKNPALMGKFSAHGDTSGDSLAVSAGVPGQLAARVVATVVVKAWALIKGKLSKSESGYTDADIQAAAELLAGLFSAVLGEDLDVEAVEKMLREKIKA